MGKSRRHPKVSLLVTAALLFAGCSADDPNGEGPPSFEVTAGGPKPGGTPPPPHRARAEIGAASLEQLRRAEPVRLIAQLHDLAEMTPVAQGDDAPTHLVRVLRRQRQALFARVGQGLEPTRELETIPAVPVTVSSLEGLERLLADDDVDAVFEDREVFTVATPPNLDLIDQEIAEAQGHRGNGTTVAVLDTGVDYTRPEFGCTAPNTPAGCGVVYASDFAPDDGALDDRGHGTNVAGIVRAVAPGTKIAALDVFRGGSALTSEIIAAIDWVIANRAVYDIVALNMSLGGGSYTSACAGDAFAVPLARARSAGIVPVVASGNNGWANAMSSPACVPAAVSVGAVYDANIGGLGYGSCSDSVTAPDRVTCFSNSLPTLTLLAPGANVRAAGYTMTGTSQATPHVAGAVALLRAAYPNDSVDQTLSRLTSTGARVTDPRQGRVTPRIDLDGALAPAAACSYAMSPPALALPEMAGSATLTVKTSANCSYSLQSAASWVTPPGGMLTGSRTVTLAYAANPGTARSATVKLGDVTVGVTQAGATAAGGPPASAATVRLAGGATATRTTTVTLDLSHPDPSTVAQVCISNTTSCSTWTPYSASRQWTLASGEGAKTVRVWFWLGSKQLEATSPISTTIVLDTTAPTNGAVTATPADAKALLSWTGFVDRYSGIERYKVVGAPTTPPRSCSSGTVLYEGPLASAAPTLANGQLFGVRVCAIDAAGNVSTGATAVVLPRPELVPPTGAVTIANGAATTSTSRVTASLAATDASGVSSMCVSTTPTCTAWVPFAPQAIVTLAPGDGVRTVYARFRDAYANESAPVSDTIVADVTPPVNGAISSSPKDGALLVKWSGFSDSGSGIARYRVVYAPTSAPASCATGTLAGETTASEWNVTGLVNGTAYGVRVCAVDGGGLVSTGVTGVGCPRP